MSWSYLNPILEKLSNNSTLLGKYWVSIVIFRFVILNTFIESIWSDEFSNFLCNTKEIGCEHLCFNKFTPISNIRLWGLQLLCISLPAGLYLIYVWHLVVKIENLDGKLEVQVEKPPKLRSSQSNESLNLRRTTLEKDPLQKEDDPLAVGSVYSGFSNFRDSRRNSRAYGNNFSHYRKPHAMSHSQKRPTFTAATQNKIRHPTAPDLTQNFSHSNMNYIPDWYIKPAKKNSKKYLEYEKIKKSIVPVDLQKHMFQKQKNERNIWKFYYLQVLLRGLLDGVFVYLQYFIYPYDRKIPKIYECLIPEACTPHSIDCYVSRPFEKTLFFHYMGLSSVLCIFVSLLEFYKLGIVRLFYLIFYGPKKDLKAAVTMRKESSGEQLQINVG